MTTRRLVYHRVETLMRKGLELYVGRAWLRRGQRVERGYFTTLTP